MGTDKKITLNDELTQSLPKLKMQQKKKMSLSVVPILSSRWGQPQPIGV